MEKMLSRENYVVSTNFQYKKKQNKITDRWLSNIPIILLEQVLLEHLEPYSCFTNSSQKVQYYLKTDLFSKVAGYGSPNVAIFSEKKYVLSEENNQCNVIKFLFLSIIFHVKLKKKTYFRTKKK